MRRTTSEIVSILKEFIPFAEDDVDNDNVQFLYQLIDELSQNLDSHQAIRPCFLFLEKHPNHDFGSPGPIVHFLEEFSGKYERELLDSLSRRPTELTIWMLNRMINNTESLSTRDHLISKLNMVIHHPLSTKKEIESAINFLAFQRGE